MSSPPSSWLSSLPDLSWARRIRLIGDTVGMTERPELGDVMLDVHEGVALVTLQRPDRRNAFTGRMGDDLGHVYAWCDTNDDVRAVVLTGAAEGAAFCAGADMASGGDTFASRSGERRAFSSSPIRPRAWEIRKPVIAAVNGHAIGIGMTIAMQCDIRILAVGAKYGFVHVRRGVIPDAHSHWTLPRAAGFAAAAELLLTGRHFDAAEAVAMGIASSALPAEEVLPAALAIAHDIAVNTAPLSVAISKWILWSSPVLDADETDAVETAMHEHLMGKADAEEGVLAFLERRAPRWALSPTRDWPEWPPR